jgi:hypothetical protein
MHRLLVVLAVVAFLPGCFLVFDEHGKGGDDDCLLPPGDDTPTTEAEPAPQRNPENLVCQSFGGGGTCDPSCGPCPAAGQEDALAPIPSWGFCNGFCESLDETACAADGGCRVIKDARCAVEGNCETDFVGCVATDQFIDTSIDCNAITDGQRCSQNPACTAFHRESLCPLHESPVPPQCTRDFGFCGDEGVAPGRCFDAVTCEALPPTCPSGSTAGVIGGCFSGACIPDDLCEATPPSS